MKELMQYSYLFMEQTWLMMMKHISQRQRKGRQFWKDSVLIEIVVLAFVIFILYFASELYYTDATYLKHSLPPLSTTGPWGIFGTVSVNCYCYFNLFTKLCSTNLTVDIIITTY